MNPSPADPASSAAVGDPLITVITPAHNVGKYIGEAIDSVLAQTENRFEYLVVDDASEDDTASVVRDRAAKDARVRLLESDHRGSSGARNIGLREARGQYIAFIDGDDRWNPQFLEKMLLAMTKAPRRVGVIFCQGRIIDDSGRVYWRRFRSARDYDLDDMLIYDNPTGNGSLLLFRRSCFDEAGLFDEELQSAVDLEMWLRIGSQSNTPIFRAIRDALIDVRVRPGAMSRDSSTRLNAIQQILDTWIPRLRPESRSRAYVRPAVVAFRAGDDERAETWAAVGETAGTSWLLRDGYGRQLLRWQKMSRSQREQFRKASATGKSLIIKSILKAASVVSR